MYKKYVANGNFRNLVRPATASIIDFNRRESLNLGRMGMQEKKKRCCN